jgi:NAD(P)-dependent dehydrogenase (short-subunit alcohol dehydrogenase family)
MDDLEGKVAVVTGGAGGIGAESARALAQCGASVVVADKDGSGAKVVADGISSNGAVALALEVDLADAAATESMVRLAVDTYGGIDILFNNGADTGDFGDDGTIVDQTIAGWDHIMSVNLRAPMVAAKTAIPYMVERGGGVIINTISPAGLLADYGHLKYGVSKAGLTLMTLHIACSHGPQNIRCHAIAPGAIIGPNTEANLPPAFFEQRARHTPSPRLGKPSDIANVVTFLCRHGSEYLNGLVIPVDGGFLAHLPHFADHRALQG